MSAVKHTSGTSRTTGISSASLTAGSNVLGSAIANQSNLDRFAVIEAQWTCSTASTANRTLEIYILPAVDGTNHADGDASNDPYAEPVAVFKDDGGTGAQRRTSEIIELPPFAFKLLVKSELDQNATSLTVLLYSFNEDVPVA